jgi:hypothetical protein
VAATSEAALTVPPGTRVAAGATTRAVHLGILVLSLAVFGVLSVALRQDNNWDLRNYHYYIPYAFLTGRLGFDIGPASIQTFLNPLLDVPFYLLIEHLSPRWVGFVLGALHGLNFWLAFELAWWLWRTRQDRAEAATGVVFALVCAGLGVYGAGAASELGTTFHDLTLAPLIVGSLFVLLRASSKPAAGAGFFAGGLLLGIAVGLKQTSGVYVPGMGAMLLVGGGYAWRNRVRALVHWGTGLAIGALLTAGYWMHVLYTQFGNPLGPYFNTVFRSPYFPSGIGLDTRFFPKTGLQRLFYPFYFHVRAQTVMESWFQDARWAILYLLVVVTGGVLVIGRWRRRRVSTRLPADHRMLLVFGVVSYVVWQCLFSVYRYLIPLEVLCPILIYVCLRAIIPRDAQTRLAVCFALFVLIAGAVRLPTWGRVPWSASFFGTEAPRLPHPADTVVLMTGTPTAFVVPAFPREVRFVRVDGIFSANEATRVRDFIASLVRSHSGDFYLLWQRQVIADPDRHLLPYGLRASTEACEPVRNNADPHIVLCPASRTMMRDAD